MNHLSKDIHHQDLNQIGNWFSDAFNTITDKVSDAMLWASESYDSSYNWASAKASQLTASSRKQLEDFQAAVESLFKTQKQVDEALNALPDGPLKTRLENKKKEARGMFTGYVLPAWESFLNWSGMSSNANFGGNAFGAIPFIGIAAVLGAVSVAMVYVTQSHNLEKQILNDPELAKVFVTERAKSGLFNIGGSTQYLVMGAVGLGGIFLLSQMVKK